MNTVALVRSIARGIRYRPLPDLFDQKLIINSIDTVEADIHKGLGDLLPDECTLASSINPLAIARYGILDLRFAAPASALTTGYQSGVPLLRELGFVHTRKRARNNEPEPPDTGVLEELAEDIAKGQTFLMLFLKSDSALTVSDLRQMSREARQEWLANPTLPAGHFPKVFVVVDACLANAEFVWFAKHFYW